MSNHTPGPWEYRQGVRFDAVECREINSGDFYIFGVSNGYQNWFIASVPGDDNVKDCGVSQSDARLIAAAPDLLAALESMVLYYGCRPSEDDESENLYRLVGKALDKARGKTK